MNKEERFEIFNEYGKWVIKDNEELPSLLDSYLCCVRLNKFAEQVADLEAKLAGLQQENKVLKDIRTLERVVPRNAQINKLSNRDCYIKGFENALSEIVRTFEEAYGKEKCKLVQERDKYLTDIVKVGGYEYQIEELKQQLAEKEQRVAELEDKDWYEACIKQLEEQNGRLIEERDNYKLQLAEKNEEIKKLTLLYFGDENTETVLTTNKMINHTRMLFAVEQLEKVKEFVNDNLAENYGLNGSLFYVVDSAKLCKEIDQQIKQLKEK